MAKVIETEASLENLTLVLDQISEQLEAEGCRQEQILSIVVAAEEIFTNIAQYAYCPETGKVEIKCQVDTDGGKNQVEVVFSDYGHPFNPLNKEDPDITIPAEERQIGGLGIFMVKKMMDDVTYFYEEGQNKLIIRKQC